MKFDRDIDDVRRSEQARSGPSKAELSRMLQDAVANTGGKSGRPDDRRFSDKAELDPAAVRSLPANHPALLENRTLFPGTVAVVDENFPDRLLVSGKNNRKLGERILKGTFKGYALYGLSLEERATCPESCAVRAYCYGNGMHMARRHRITDLKLFKLFLDDEINSILSDPVEGLMVRLHVLGDFPSAEYVEMWGDLLKSYDRLACYGYTHRLPIKRGGDKIGNAIDALKARQPKRFRIRWSTEKPGADSAVVIDRIPDGKRVNEGIVCPAQTDATGCCASCSLCWEGSAKSESIVFIKHGPKSLQALADAEPAVAIADKPIGSDEISTENVRPVKALNFPQKRERILYKPPQLRFVDPTTLKVEPSYQRDLSSKSMKLIRKIVLGWSWAKFKPPICAETSAGLFVIDGQHTAIAAASHPEIKEIPVMILDAPPIADRADAFVAHNRDRMNMTAAQIFYGEMAAGNVDAKAIFEIIGRVGGSIPRVPVPKGYAKPGQITAVSAMRDGYRRCGALVFERMMRIAVLSKITPISMTVIRGIEIALTEAIFAEVAKAPDTKIAAALASIKNTEATCRHHAAETGQSTYRACASLISKSI